MIQFSNITVQSAVIKTKHYGLALVAWSQWAVRGVRKTPALGISTGKLCTARYTWGSAAGELSYLQRVVKPQNTINKSITHKQQNSSNKHTSLGCEVSVTDIKTNLT